MASTGFPALAINTTAESPLKQYAQIEQIRASQQALQMGAIQLQEARVAQQSRETLQALWAKNSGDMNQTLADAKASGKVTPNDLLNFQEKGVAIQTQAAKLTSEQLGNVEKEHGILETALEGYKSLPPEQR